MRHSKQILVRFILSFTIVMCIPFLFFTAIVSGQIRQSETEKAMNVYQDAAHTISKSFDNFFSQKESFELNLMKQKYFYNFYLKQNGGAFVYTQNYFKTVGSQNSLFYYTYFFSRTTNQFYGISTYSYNRYLDSLNTPDETVKTGLTSSLDCSQESFLPPYHATLNGIRSSFVTFVVPFEYETPATDLPCSFIVFNVPSSTFEDFCRPILLDDSILVMARLNGKPIWANKSDLLSQTEDTPWEERTDSAALYTIAGKEYRVVSDVSPNTDLEIVGLIPTELFESTIASVLRLYIVISIIGFLIGCVLICIFVKYNYTPIRALDSTLQSVCAPSPSRNNFFDTVSSAIQKLSVQNQMMQWENLQMEKEKLFLKLLSLQGNDASFESLKSACMEQGIDLNFRFFLCGICSFAERPLSVEGWREQGPVRDDGYSLSVYYQEENNCMIFLLCSGFESLSRADAILLHALSESFPDGIPPFRLGVGGYKKKITMISRSYYEAFSALNSCEEYANQILHDKDVKRSGSTNIPLLMKESYTLRRAILNQDPDLFTLSYHILLNGLRENGNRNFCGFLCFDIISRCMEAVQNTNLVCGHTFYSSLNELMEMHQNPESAAECLRIFSEVMEEIRDCLVCSSSTGTVPEDGASTADIQAVIQVIHEHYLDDTFSAKELASRFHTSTSNISHLFKNKTGTTLSDYVNNLKINTVKQMLTETDYTIAYIAQYVGYYHTSNFIKKFKKTEGVTPNEYRILHQKSREKKEKDAARRM